jgi:hypothetical protein
MKCLIRERDQGGEAERQRQTDRDRDQKAEIKMQTERDRHTKRQADSDGFIKSK